MAIVSVQDERDAPFRVAIEVGELATRDRLRVECQCAFFTAGHPCGHVYASLLALEAEGEVTRLVPERAVERRLDVVPHRTGLPLAEDAFFEGSHGFSRKKARSSDRSPDWRGRLETLRRSAVPPPTPLSGILDGLELVLDPTRSESAGAPVITAYAPDPEDGRRRPVGLARRDLDRITDRALRAGLEPWLACPPLGQRSGAEALAQDPGQLVADTRRVPQGLQRALFLTLSGRFRLGEDGPLIVLDDTEPWRLELTVTRQDAHLSVDGSVVREGLPPRPVDEVRLMLRDGWLVVDQTVAPFEAGPAFDWARHLRREGPLLIEGASPGELFEVLGSLPTLPRLRLHGDLDGWRIHPGVPVPAMVLGGPDPRSRRARAELTFAYEGVSVGHQRLDAALVDLDAKRLIVRDLETERAWLRRLLSIGLEADDDAALAARTGALPDLERALVELGVRVEREGTRLRRGNSSRLRVQSGIDWFEIDGEVDFEGATVDLSLVLEALRQRSDRVQLSDGSEGVITEAEARRLRALAGLGQKRQGKLRFAQSQAVLLDALLAEEVEVHRDAAFQNLLEALRGDLSVAPSPEPAGFQGELRAYQRLGLGWLLVLRRLGLGGCLADDMGLGKTVQVLALLLDTHRRSNAGERRPSLVVAPRSLVFNWRQEAERFTPELRVVEYAGQQRSALLASSLEADLLLTTYGTLRRDIAQLAALSFEYVVLDEAQTIKNHAAQVSKACRALRARHRLALSGTPVENDVSELWSIFEFLNPRMLGARRDFVRLAQGDALGLVARALSPLLLRRRKEDVLAELPEKTELTVYCDLQPDERRLYDALRSKYRQEIDQKAATAGLAALRTDVLEALLRLRQMACHPGLVDEKRRSGISTKVETLVAHLEEVVAEGHKALVFSQFVKLLEIVGSRLRRAGITHTYLDGQVRDRASVVARFQNDPECPVFLISLRAGALGLNLTAADYVFVLDPWWNPAVEAQAIDRAHRIGQTRPVFAYRYIARDTVEEKILELHRDKRALAEALVGGDLEHGGKLSLDELRLLLH